MKRKERGEGIDRGRGWEGINGHSEKNERICFVKGTIR